MNEAFDKYFHDVLLCDSIYIEYCDALGDLCVENTIDDNTELPFEAELKYQQFELLKETRYNYIFEYCKKLWLLRN